MDPFLNNNQDNKSFHSQFELNENNYNNNIYNNINPYIKIINLQKKNENSSISSQNNNSQIYIKRKRKNHYEEKNEEHENLLNEFKLSGIPDNCNSLIKKEIEEKKNKKIRLEEDIQKMETQLTSLNYEIENYKKIDKFLEAYDNLFIEKSSHEGERDAEDNIDNIDNYSNSKEDLYSFNKNLNQFEELTNKNKYLIEKEFPNYENNQFKAIDNKNPFLLEETINEDIKEKNNKYGVNIDEGIEDYSFRCLSYNLNYKMKKGTKQCLVGIQLENNGKFAWPENETFLLTNEDESDFTIEEIYLNPLEPGEKYFLYFSIFNLEKYDSGLYRIYFVLNVKGKNYGSHIIINLEIYE